MGETYWKQSITAGAAENGHSRQLPLFASRSYSRVDSFPVRTGALCYKLIVVPVRF